ncbi:MAG: NADP-dependent malic enzyme [Clostridia bacterium]|nr:NADP-dependent malic enzyme [Clostridia bacterium]
MTDAMQLHTQVRGKIEMTARVPVKNARDMALAYTPGVAEPCLEIQKDYAKSFELTRRWNTVAVITDGTAVLGLGDIGPEAGMPVMEGKCVLFKEFGGIDAIPLCLRTKDVDELVRTIYLMSGSFGGINLEDISAPRCFEVERRLKEICDIPVFHDDQHGTAVVVGAAVLNAVRLTGRALEDLRVVISGAGSAGCAIARHLLKMGVRDIVLSDKCGLLCAGDDTLSPAHRDMAALTNPRRLTGSLADAMVGADVFIGVSAGGIVSEEMVRSMADRPVVFAMANPVPEIAPDLARAAGAYIIGTGRSDFPNQINNVLAFPGIFRGALDVRAAQINDEMQMAASRAIAALVDDSELCPEYILPRAFDPRIGPAVAKAVAEEARKTGEARI